MKTLMQATTTIRLEKRHRQIPAVTGSHVPRVFAAPAMVVMAVAMAHGPATAHQAVIEGPATVIDADTIDIGATRIRLWGIDAPERDQTCNLGKLIYHCGQLAADELATFLDGRNVRCRRKDTDRHGRIVAVCHASTGQDIAAWLVEHGYAFDWPRYSDGHYNPWQETASTNRAGLWNGTFEWPWKWRRQ